MRNWLKELTKQWRCLWGGHDGPRETDGTQVFIRCSRCGRRSPGWNLDRPRPRRTFDGDPARHRVTQAVTVRGYDYQDAAVVACLDEDTADLVAALDLAGRQDDVQLLLMPSKSDKIQ